MSPVPPLPLDISAPTAARVVPVFDLDGTLLDSDEALVAPFLALGVAREAISFGQTLDEACGHLGISVDDYVAHYDVSSALPFAGADELVRGLDRWAVCSNKRRDAGRAELARLGWEPEIALFSDDFGGETKHLGPVLDALGLTGPEVLFVGDTAHDRRCATAAGARFVLAGWNPRAVPEPGDVVAQAPVEIAGLLRAAPEPR